MVRIGGSLPNNDPGRRIYRGSNSLAYYPRPPENLTGCGMVVHDMYPTTYAHVGERCIHTMFVC